MISIYQKTDIRNDQTDPLKHIPIDFQKRRDWAVPGPSVAVCRSWLPVLDPRSFGSGLVLLGIVREIRRDGVWKIRGNNGHGLNWFPLPHSDDKLGVLNPNTERNTNGHGLIPITIRIGWVNIPIKTIIFIEMGCSPGVQGFDPLPNRRKLGVLVVTCPGDPSTFLEVFGVWFTIIWRFKYLLRQCGAPKIAKFAYNSHFTIVNGRYIYS